MGSNTKRRRFLKHLLSSEPFLKTNWNKLWEKHLLNGLQCVVWMAVIRPDILLIRGLVAPKYPKDAKTAMQKRSPTATRAR